MKSLFLFVALLGMSSVALTSAQKMQGQTQAQMNQTEYKAYQQADAQMNVAYKKLLTVLNAKQKRQLRTAQGAWLKFRDAEGTLLASKVEGGSIYPTIYAIHEKEITQARTKELARAYRLFTTEGNM